MLCKPKSCIFSLCVSFSFAFAFAFAFGYSCVCLENINKSLLFVYKTGRINAEHRHHYHNLVIGIESLYLNRKPIDWSIYAGKHDADSTLVKHSRLCCSTNQRPDSRLPKKQNNIFVRINKQINKHTQDTTHPQPVTICIFLSSLEMRLLSFFQTIWIK